MFLASLSLAAEERFVVPEPPAGAIVVHCDLAYRDAPRLALDLYRPSGTNTVPLLIFVNNTGGAYREWPVYIGWAKAAAAHGLGAVVYQSGERAAEDFDAVMALLRTKAAELHVDPARVVIWSGSANVGLGLPLAMDRARDYIRGAAVFYGYARVEDIRLDLPVLYVRSGLDGTGLNREFNAIAARALEANAPWIIENNAAGTHRFEVENDNEVSRAVIARTLDFASTVLRPEVSRAYVEAGAEAALGAAFARGEWKVSIAGYRKKLEASPADAEAHRRLGLSLSATREHAAALAELERAWELGRRGPRDTAWPAAIAAARAGNEDRALHWLDILLSSGFGPPVAEVRTSEDFASIRGERLDALLAKFER